jgi:hypothetical protein
VNLPLKVEACIEQVLSIPFESYSSFTLLSFNKHKHSLYVSQTAFLCQLPYHTQIIDVLSMVIRVAERSYCVIALRRSMKVSSLVGTSGTRTR